MPPRCRCRAPGLPAFFTQFSRPHAVVYESKALARIYIAALAAAVLYTLLYVGMTQQRWMQFDTPAYSTAVWIPPLPAELLFAPAPGRVPYYCNNATYDFGTDASPIELALLGGAAWANVSCLPVRVGTQFIVADNSAEVITTRQFITTNLTRCAELLAARNESAGPPPDGSLNDNYVLRPPHTFGSFLPNYVSMPACSNGSTFFYAGIENVPLNFLFSLALPGATRAERKPVVPSLTLWASDGVTLIGTVPQNVATQFITVGTIMAMANISMDSRNIQTQWKGGDPSQSPFYRLTGASIQLRYSCRNFRPWSFSDDVTCDLHAYAQPEVWGTTTPSIGPHPLTGVESTVLSLAIRISIVSDSQIGSFSFGNLITMLTSAIVLFGVCGTITHYSAMYLCPRQFRLRYRKFRTTEVRLSQHEERHDSRAQPLLDSAESEKNDTLADTPAPASSFEPAGRAQSNSVTAQLRERLRIDTDEAAAHESELAVVPRAERSASNML